MKTTKTSLVVLGLLSIKPMAGYEMKAIIQKSIGHFWSESNGQLYPALKDLAQNKLIAIQASPKDNKKQKHIYAITDLGQAQLNRWMSEMVEHKSVHRDEELLKLFFGKNNSAENSIKLLQNRKDRLSKKQEEYLSIKKEIERFCHSPHYPYWVIALNNGIMLTEAEIYWCQNSIALLSHTESLR